MYILYPRVLLLLLLLPLTTAGAAPQRANLYDVLDAPRDADAKALKRAYRGQARTLHPDKHPKERKAEFEKKFIELANAYEILSDPETRAAYDRNPNGYFEQESAQGSGYHDFESAFRRHGFDGGHAVDDTPLNRLVVVLMLLSLAAPAAYVGAQKFLAKPAANASRAQLLQTLAPKTVEEEQRLREAEQREAQRRQQRRDERNTMRQRAQERSAAELGAVKKADIKAVITQSSEHNNTGRGTDAAPGAARRATHRIIKEVDEAWTEKEDALLLTACKKYTGGTPQRWEKIANYVGSRDKNGVLKRVKKLKIRLTSSVGGRGGGPPSARASANRANAQSASGSGVGGGSGGGGRGGAAGAGGGGSGKGGAGSDNVTDWTREEQSRLEMALKTVPSSLPKIERWTNISEIVKTRTKGECARRFKELRAMLKKARNAPPR
jgi:curved DNA-binding protein CbpA